MIPDLFSSTTIPALGEVINFAQARHTVLAGNIANVNTPGYRLRDLSPTEFQQRLKEALAQSQQANQPISPGLSASRPGDPLRQVRASLENIVYHDDTNIDPLYRWQPSHPYAIKEGAKKGYVAYPRVNMTAEMVDALVATRAYEANIGAMELSKNMAQQSLRILG